MLYVGAIIPQKEGNSPKMDPMLTCHESHRPTNKFARNHATWDCHLMSSFSMFQSPSKSMTAMTILRYLCRTGAVGHRESRTTHSRWKDCAQSRVSSGLGCGVWTSIWLDLVVPTLDRLASRSGSTSDSHAELGEHRRCSWRLLGIDICTSLWANTSSSWTWERSKWLVPQPDGLVCNGGLISLPRRPFRGKTSSMRLLQYI